MKKITTGILCIILILALVWVTGRYGWKVMGFSGCESAGIENVIVADDHVRIRGFYPGSFPRGFLGYHAEQENTTLYVGFRFSGVFGYFETGDFDITIPTEEPITRICIKTDDSEFLIWSTAQKNDPTEPEETEHEPEPILFSLKHLNCLSPEFLPTLLPAGDAKVFVCWPGYNGEHTNLAVVDIRNDQVLANIRLEGEWVLLEKTFADGSYALRNTERKSWRFLSADLELAGAFDAEDVGGFFSTDREIYYWIKDHILYSTDVSTGETKPVQLSHDLRFTEILAVHPSEDNVALRFLLSPYQSICGTAILDLESGNYTLMTESRYQVDFLEKGPSLFYFDETQMGYNVLYEEGLQPMQADASLFRADLQAISGAPYLMDIGDTTVLFHLSDGITACALSDWGIEGSFRSGCWLPELGIIVGGVFREGQFHLSALMPQQLSFEAKSGAEAVDSFMELDTKLADAYWNALSGGPVSDTLQGAREFADRLEEKYGVSILISNQCAGPVASCSYPITTTDQMDLTNEAYDINRTLVALDQTFSLYPQGFFAQFPNRSGEGGIRVLLVGYIDSGYGAIGCSFKTGSWHNIAIDVRMDDFESLLCHEIWHATEDRIVSVDTDSFTWDVWSPCNPEGFSYYNDYSLTDPEQNRWTLFSTGAEDAHFIDSYSRVNAKEDRARIMEYIMAKPEYAAQIKASPAIMKKLQIMCDAIRENFNTSQWKDLPWELLLKQ